LGRRSIPTKMATSVKLDEPGKRRLDGLQARITVKSSTPSRIANE